jgi:hypothetical protein
LERWVEQLAQVTYRPYLLNAFIGSGTLSANLSENNPNESLNWKLTGEMPVSDNPSPLIRGISSTSRDLQLDRFISINAAAFSIFQLEPRMVPADDEPSGDLDLYLSENTDRYREIASTVDTETAFVAFAESGFMSSSEFLFLRMLDNPAQFRSILNNFASEGLIQRDDNIYIINSLYLGKLIGSDLSTIRNFYLGIHNNTISISRSRNLVETVGLDHDRRRVMFYDDHFIQIRESLPSTMSSFTYVDTPNFNSYIQPWLYPQNYFGALSSNLEILTIITDRENNSSH